MRNVFFDQTASDLRLHVPMSGYCQCTPRWHIRDLPTPFCRLYIPESGSGLLELNGETIVMEPGYAYLLPPEVPISYSCPESMVKLYFHLELLTPDHYDLFFGCRHILQTPVSQAQFARYLSLYQSESYYSCLQLKTELYQLLLQLYRQLPLYNAKAPSYSEEVRSTIDYIHRHLSAQLTANELAQRLRISGVTLNKRFRTELGMTVRKYVEEQLLMQAKALLCHTELSIADISARLGFSDQFYFSNKFKVCTGYTPRLYRRLHTDHGNKEIQKELK